jgi:hypothetical protein
MIRNVKLECNTKLSIKECSKMMKAAIQFVLASLGHELFSCRTYPRALDVLSESGPQ